MKLKHILFAAIAATAISLPSAYADAPDTTTTAASTNSTSDEMAALFGDPVLAKGTGVEVKRSDVDQILSGIKSQYMAQGREIPPDQLTRMEAEMLERLIDIQLLLQNANDADRADGAKKADAAMASLLDRSGGSQEMLDKQLEALGTTEADLRKKVGQEATAMATLQRVLGVNVTADDIQKFYDAHPADVEQPEMVHVRHILFMTMDPTTRTPLSEDVIEAKHKQAEDVLVRARAGEDFAKLAEQYSDDTTTKEKGGELPPFSHGQMVPEFEAAAFALTNNEISDVVQTQYGYHIIQLLDKTPAKKLALTDKVPGTDSTVSDRIKEVLAQEKTDELAPPYLAKLKKAADVQILDPDLNAEVQELSETNAVPAGGMAPAEK